MLVKGLEGVRTGRTLTLELVPKAGKPGEMTAPIISGIEVEAEGGR